MPTKWVCAGPGPTFNPDADRAVATAGPAGQPAAVAAGSAHRSGARRTRRGAGRPRVQPPATALEPCCATCAGCSTRRRPIPTGPPRRTPPSRGRELNFGACAWRGNWRPPWTSAAGAAIQFAVERFEPRLLKGTVRVRGEIEAESVLDTHNLIEFEISGQMWDPHSPIDILLRTRLDLEAGQVDVRDSAAVSRAVDTARPSLTMEPASHACTQDELIHLRRWAAEFAREHPKIASRLGSTSRSWQTLTSSACWGFAFHGPCTAQARSGIPTAHAPTCWSRCPQLPGAAAFDAGRALRHRPERPEPRRGFTVAAGSTVQSTRPVHDTTRCEFPPRWT